MLIIRDNKFLFLFSDWIKKNQTKEVIEEKEVTQKWLTKQLGKSYNTINEYARNVRQPSLEDLYKIAEILNVEPAALLTKKNEV